MVPGLPAPLIVTGVPSGSEPESQPLVSVEPPVPEQCAACPMSVSVPLVKTKFAVHWPPSVTVWTPGWILAVEAGAHADAIDGAMARAAIAAVAAKARRSMLLPPGDRDLAAVLAAATTAAARTCARSRGPSARGHRGQRSALPGHPGRPGDGRVQRGGRQRGADGQLRSGIEPDHVARPRARGRDGPLDHRRDLVDVRRAPLGLGDQLAHPVDVALV